MTQERRTRNPFKRFFINRRYQLKYTFMVVAVSTLITASFGYLYYRNERAQSEMLAIQSPDLAAMVSSSDCKVLFTLLAFFVLQFAVIFFFGLFYTHRVAGPVYRLQKYFEEVERTGELKDFQGVREKDEFLPLFETLSRAIAAVRNKRS